MLLFPYPAPDREGKGRIPEAMFRRVMLARLGQGEEADLEEMVDMYKSGNKDLEEDKNIDYRRFVAMLRL